MLDKLKRDVRRVKSVIAEFLDDLEKGKTDKCERLLKSLEVLLDDEHRKSKLEEVRIAYNKAEKVRRLLEEFLKTGNLEEKREIETLLGEIMDLEDRLEGVRSDLSNIPHEKEGSIKLKIKDITQIGTVISYSNSENLKKMYNSKNVSLNALVIDDRKVKLSNSLEKTGMNVGWFDYVDCKHEIKDALIIQQRVAKKQGSTKEGYDAKWSRVFI